MGLLTIPKCRSFPSVARSSVHCMDGSVIHGFLIIVHGRCPWTMIRNPWMTEPSVQWMDERATLGKLRHFGMVNKPMIIALNSSSS